MGLGMFQLTQEEFSNLKSQFVISSLFQLTRDEAASLTSQIAMSKSGCGGRRTLPYAFTVKRMPGLEIRQKSLPQNILDLFNL